MINILQEAVTKKGWLTQRQYYKIYRMLRRLRTSTRSSECLLVTTQQDSLKADSKGEESLVVYVVFRKVNNFITCYTTEPLTLEERRKHVVAGEAWRNMSTGVVNPFQGLKKDEKLLELDTKGIWLSDERKCAVQEKWNEMLNGIAPAFCCLDPTKTTSQLNIESYEVLACESLHDNGELERTINRSSFLSATQL